MASLGARGGAFLRDDQERGTSASFDGPAGVDFESDGLTMRAIPRST